MPSFRVHVIDVGLRGQHVVTVQAASPDGARAAAKAPGRQIVRVKLDRTAHRPTAAGRIRKREMTAEAAE